MSTKIKIAQNTLYQLIGKGVSLSITVLATLIIAKAYGREEYGIFSLLQSWPAFFFVIIDFGINAVATKDITKDRSKEGKYFGNILLLRIFLSLSIITLLSLVILLFPYSNELIFGLRLSLFLILTQGLYSACNIIFQSRLRYDLSTIGYVLGYVFILAGIIFLSWQRVSVIWINFGYVIGGFITFFINYIFVRKLGVKPEFKLDPELIKYLLVQALPLGIMFIFSQFSFKEDEIMLSFLPVPPHYGLNNNEVVALYSLPYKIFEVALVLPTFLMNAVFPVMVTHHSISGERLKSTFKKVLYSLTALGLGTGLIAFIFAPLAISILGGSEFSQSILVLKILSIGFVLYFVTSPVSWMIVTLGKQKYLPIIYFISAIFNFIANLIFIPKYSFYAAAIITHASELLVLFMLIFALRRAWKQTYA